MLPSLCIVRSKKWSVINNSHWILGSSLILRKLVVEFVESVIERASLWLSSSFKNQPLTVTNSLFSVRFCPIPYPTLDPSHSQLYLLGQNFGIHGAAWLFVPVLPTDGTMAAKLFCARRQQAAPSRGVKIITVTFRFLIMPFFRLWRKCESASLSPCGMKLLSIMRLRSNAFGPSNMSPLGILFWSKPKLLVTEKSIAAGEMILERTQSLFGGMACPSQRDKLSFSHCCLEHKRYR